MSVAVWTGNPSALLKRSSAHPESVLCAIERGEEAEDIVNAAVDVARVYSARVILAHVVESSLEFNYSPARPDLLKGAERWLHSLKRKLHLDLPHLLLDAEITAEGTTSVCVLA